MDYPKKQITNYYRLWHKHWNIVHDILHITGRMDCAPGPRKNRIIKKVRYAKLFEYPQIDSALSNCKNNIIKQLRTTRAMEWLGLRECHVDISTWGLGIGFWCGDISGTKSK